MVWTRSPVYFYHRGDIYYFSRAVHKDLQARFNKRGVELSLKTKSADKARSSSMTLSDRLERYWDSLRLEQIRSRELRLIFTFFAPTTGFVKRSSAKPKY